MAKNNPWQNLEKLRAESGSEEIITASSFDQTEPASSYKLGNSIMSVDMTPSDWPGSGIGMVSTSKVTDLLASQNFLPVGSTTSYNRNWDESLGAQSDDFEGSLNATKWKSIGPSTIATSLGLLTHTTVTTADSITQSNFAYAGDFDIQIYHVERGSANLWPAMMVCTLPSLDATFHGGAAGKMGAYGTAHSVNGVNKGAAVGVFDHKYYRLTRVGNLGSAYYKVLEGDAWIPIFENEVYTYDDVFVAIYIDKGSSNGETTSFDDYVENVGSPYMLSGGAASWKGWTEYKSPAVVEQENQAYADTAVTTHETSYDHETYNTHTSNVANPHGVTAAQVSADPVGSASTAITNHETTFNHTLLTTINDKAIDRGWVQPGVMTTNTYVRETRNLENGSMFAYCNNGHVLRTLDDGYTWEDVTPVDVDAHNIRPATYWGPDDAIYYVDAAANIRLSRDYGTTWPIVGAITGTIPAASMITSFSSDRNDSGMFVIQTVDDGDTKYQFDISLDYGATWARTDYVVVGQHLKGVRWLGGTKWLIGTNITQDFTYDNFATFVGVYAEEPVSNGDHSTYHFTDHKEGIFFSDAGQTGVYRSTDGISWAYIPYPDGMSGPLYENNTGYGSPNHLYILPDGSYMLAVNYGSGGVIRSHDKGLTWFKMANLWHIAYGLICTQDMCFVNQTDSTTVDISYDGVNFAPMTTKGFETWPQWADWGSVTPGGRIILFSEIQDVTWDPVAFLYEGTIFTPTPKPFPVVASSLTRTKIFYVDDAGGNVEFDTTTTFTDINDVDVYLNGLRILSGSEFIDSVGNPGSYITLTTPTVAGDDIEIVVWNA